MVNIKKSLEAYPCYLLLLPVFFVLHGVVENYPLIPINDAARLIAIYLASSLLLAFLSWLIYKDISKAFLLAFFIMAYQFAFGSLIDFLKQNFTNAFFLRYRFILPLSLVGLLSIFICIKRRKKPLYPITLYLNSLLIILILIDTASLLIKQTLRKEPVSTHSPEIIPCNNCPKPDIYLIVADEYAGYSTLKDFFQFDNSLFETGLKNRGFHVIQNSQSNYNFTPYSIASMLNMDYLSNLDGRNSSSHDMAICYATIKENRVFDFFKRNGYAIQNYSIFDLPGQPTITKSTLLHGKTKPITSQTFTYRLIKELGYHLATNLNLKFAIENIVYKELRGNEKIISLTRNTVAKKSNTPKLVYTHLLMPHYPYYYDSKGIQKPIEELTPHHHVNQKGYIEYLQYTNNKLLELIDYIKANSPQPPIIILMSDHGFRQYKENVEKKYSHLTLNSIFFSDSNYRNFYNGMTNVNQFRAILNSKFGQQLPFLKDSISFLRP